MRDTPEVAAAAKRMVAAVGKRVGMEDPEGLAHLSSLEFAVTRAMVVAVNGLREGGHTDKAIGEALGMSRQAVQQRWPRADGVRGAGARYLAR